MLQKVEEGLELQVLAGRERPTAPILTALAPQPHLDSNLMGRLSGFGHLLGGRSGWKQVGAGERWVCAGGMGMGDWSPGITYSMYKGILYNIFPTPFYKSKIILK